MPAAALVHRLPTTERHPALDDRWNQQMTRLLREAAEVRDERERARSSEDELLAQREVTALPDLIRTHGAPPPRDSAHLLARLVPHG